MKGSRSRVRTGSYSLLFLLVVSSAPAWAVDLREGLDQMAAQLAKGAPEGKQFRVAVADFPDLQGVISDLGRFIANRLTTRLVQNPKFSVIERQRLNQVLGELKFSISDLVDPNKAKQLGRMVGVEGLVVGAVSDLGNQVDIDARMIEIESNKMLLGATITISKDPTVTALLERGREMSAPPSIGGGPMGSPMIAAPAPGVSVGSVKYQDFAAFRVEVEGLEVNQDGSVVLYLGYTNKTKNALTIDLDGSYNTKLFDDAENKYELRTGTFVGGRLNNVSPGSRDAASLVFALQGGKKKANSFSFVSPHVISTDEGRNWQRHTLSIRGIQPR